MAYTTVWLQTITDIEGEGVDSPQDLNLTYRVSQGCTAGVQYVRAGNTTEGMINITVLKDGKAMRYVPVAAGGGHTRASGDRRRAAAGDRDLYRSCGRRFG